MVENHATAGFWQQILPYNCQVSEISTYKKLLCRLQHVGILYGEHSEETFIGDSLKFLAQKVFVHHLTMKEDQL
jgi:hypothetical protein